MKQAIELKKVTEEIKRAERQKKVETSLQFLEEKIAPRMEEIANKGISSIKVEIPFPCDLTVIKDELITLGYTVTKDRRYLIIDWS